MLAQMALTTLTLVHQAYARPTNSKARVVFQFCFDLVIQLFIIEGPWAANMAATDLAAV